MIDILDANRGKGIVENDKGSVWEEFHKSPD
jgi:hypothetical protein